MRGKNWVNLMKNALTKVKTSCTCDTAANSVTLVAHRCNYLCDLRCLHAGVSYRTNVALNTSQNSAIREHGRTRNHPLQMSIFFGNRES